MLRHCLFSLNALLLEQSCGLRRRILAVIVVFISVNQRRHAIVYIKHFLGGNLRNKFK